MLSSLLSNYHFTGGTQPFTSGPTYAGSIVMFLFIFGLIFVKSEMRVWILLATIMSIMLAWGKKFYATY